jgi:hypothetical protein
MDSTSEQKTQEDQEEAQYPDQAFFDACANGDNDYIRSKLAEEVDFDWFKTFEFTSEGEDLKVVS